MTGRRTIRLLNESTKYLQCGSKYMYVFKFSLYLTIYKNVDNIYGTNK